MTGLIKKSFMCWILVATLFCVMGCSEPEKGAPQPFLIKTPSRIITTAEFLEELDLKRAAYPYNIHENPAEYNEMVIDLVKMLSEEIILLSAAADKGINVTDKDLDAAEIEFKKDYPEDSFEQVLLKNAISYPFWKKRFKKNMIMDKLIDQELKQKVVISAEDIVEFYKEHRIFDAKNVNGNARVLKKIESEKDLVSQLRRQKTQDHYTAWIQQLGNDYPVEINKESLKKILLGLEKSKESQDEKEN